jgi:4-alpha-glucanotransferase
LHALHADGQAEQPLVVTPARLELPAGLAERRAWGFMTQLYSVRSERSWGLGDLADLAELAAWSARAHGAGFVLVNPLHAAEPVPPMQSSPYLPVTRRFVNPIYLRVEDVHEVAYMPSSDRAIIEWSAEAMRGLNADAGELDRDAVWDAKKAALETVFEQPRTPGRQASLEAFCEREGQGLIDFATWCPRRALRDADVTLAEARAGPAVGHRRAAPPRTGRAGLVLHVAAMVPRRAARCRSAVGLGGRDAAGCRP